MPVWLLGSRPVFLVKLLVFVVGADVHSDTIASPQRLAPGISIRSLASACALRASSFAEASEDRSADRPLGISAGGSDAAKAPQLRPYRLHQSLR